MSTQRNFSNRGSRGRGRAGRGDRGFRGGRGRGVEIFMGNRPAVIDDRFEEQGALISQFEMQDWREEMPLNPGLGTEGTPVTLRANFFPLTIPGDSTIYEYEMAISPSLRAEMRPQFADVFNNSPELSEFKECIAHDSSQRLVSSELLPQPLDTSITIKGRGVDKVFDVKVKFLKDLNTSDIIKYMNGLDPQRLQGQWNPTVNSLIGAYDLVVQQHASRTGIRVGDRFFFPVDLDRFHLTLGLEACMGFFVSVRPTYQQLMVNINPCMAAFYVPGNLAEAMDAFRGNLPPWFVKGLEVVTNYNGYSKKKIFGISNMRPEQATFYDKVTHRTKIVAGHFKSEYNIDLQRPDLFVVDVGRPGDSTREPVWIPPELCEIPPFQPFHNMLPPEASKEMIKVASKTPFKNATTIVEKGFPILGFKPVPATSILPGFGVSISDQMTVLPGRTLEAPQVAYEGGRAKVRNASWNLIGSKFCAGANMGEWAVLLIAGFPGTFRGSGDPELVRFLRAFTAVCRGGGMVAPENYRPEIWETSDLNSATQVQILGEIQNTMGRGVTQWENGIRGKKPSFLLVLLPNDKQATYAGVKRFGDVDLGVHTVCMQVKKARDPKRQEQYFANVSLKVNAKLGGTNHLVDDQSMAWLTEKKTMLIGIDVTHPGPTSLPGSPSVVAVVASVDDKFFHFPACLGIQRNKNVKKKSEEMVQDLEEMVVSRLLKYKEHNGTLPEQIIVYRDGVSEGQYNLVLEKEKPLILAAFDNATLQVGQTPYQPTLSIIICSKRHKTRFYPTSAENATPNGNTLPGTVVDQGVTDLYNHEFYLQAHYGLQGTVRGTRYTVVYDEHGLDADTLQQGTLAASYLFPRATKAVSLIPVAYCADLACDRARFYLHDFLNQGDNQPNQPQAQPSTQGRGRGRGGRVQSQKRETEEEKKNRIYNDAKRVWGEGLHRDLRDSMFYL